MRPKTCLPIALLLLASAAPATAQHWSRSWAVAPQEAPAPQSDQALPDLRDRTVRQVVRLSSGGARLRVRLSNEMSEQALRIGSVHVALAGPDGQIVPGSDREVRFAGKPGALIPAHAPLLSDPVALRVAPRTRVTVSIHLPDGANQPTIHPYSAATAWTAPGDQSAAPVLRDAQRLGPRLVIAGIDVETPRPARTVVAFGDSITDGMAASVDADTRWPDLLAARLDAAGVKDLGVANLGISGNRLLADGAGLGALARFDRDVLSVPGVAQVIVLEGVNDIGSATADKRPLPTPDMLIAAYRQMIARAHDRGVKLLLGTILPYKGAGYWSAEGEAVRVAINRWIRESGEADGVVDFDRAIADAADPQRMDSRYDIGDHLHPNDAGFRAMAAAIDLKLLR